MLSIKNLTKRYGNFAAVDNISIELDEGKFLTILGPSGSGKSTTLLSVAGFVIPDTGDIYVAGKNITNLAPYKREIGMVFQNYALFQHMTVLQNIMFPLKMRRVPKPECRAKVMEYLTLVGLEGLGDRYPKELSGGQQQRVALARALVYNPPILLMDEPLGALDKQLRQKLQLEIKHIQKSLNITVIYVTHDQEEALTMSDEIIIMNNGKIEQFGTPWELYESPANKFVAEFMGESNLLKAKVIVPPKGEQNGVARLENGAQIKFATDKQLSEGDNILISIRPERINISDEPVGDNDLEGTIEETIYLGEATSFKIGLESGISVIVKQSSVLFSEMKKMQNKDKVYIHWECGAGVTLAQ